MKLAPRTRRRTPAALDSEAEQSIRFIRSTMERAASFTAVPGWGGAAMGATALAAAWLAHGAATPSAWLAIWLVEAVLACAIGIWAIRAKAHRSGTPLFAGATRRFAMTLSPPIVAGAIATVALARENQMAPLPGLWLTLYGAGVITGGASSVRAVPLLGLLILATGAAAFFTPPAWGDAWLALGFGILQTAFGVYIARRHGG